MSRNRKAAWDKPAFTVVANWRHITLHPASPIMKLTWSNLADGWKQRWDFHDEYEHTESDPSRPTLDEPRRLSWRECARIQTFPKRFTPAGSTESKFNQIGNAVPPQLAKCMLQEIVSGAGLVSPQEGMLRTTVKEKQLTLW
jgi:DNA (cytosine-5)-methyltransferase 1